MKELSIEEKAQRYDNAIEIAKSLYDYNQPISASNVIINNIFPELTESDEKIRKDIIWCLKHSGIKESNSISPHVTTTVKDAIAWLEKQGEQKPTDKVKLMFKVGDWIIYDRHISKVKDMDSEGYLVEDTYGDEGILPKEFAEKHYHLWTIAEAKDGDVLADRNIAILLFRGVGNNKWSDAIDYYALLETNLNNRFSLQEGDTYWGKVDNCGLCPATKEQRDTLMKAMADAGYTFDFEKKELKKIEQKPAWSEDDENRINRLIAYFEDKESFTAEDDIVYANWLKSLKDRVQPQTTWKPSDEHYELEEFAKIVRGNLTGISKAAQELFEAKYLQLTGNKMYGGYKD